MASPPHSQKKLLFSRVYEMKLRRIIIQINNKFTCTYPGITCVFLWIHSWACDPVLPGLRVRRRYRSRPEREQTGRIGWQIPGRKGQAVPIHEFVAAFWSVSTRFPCRLWSSHPCNQTETSRWSTDRQDSLLPGWSGPLPTVRLNRATWRFEYQVSCRLKYLPFHRLIGIPEKGSRSGGMFFSRLLREPGSGMTGRKFDSWLDVIFIHVILCTGPWIEGQILQGRITYYGTCRKYRKMLLT